MSARLGLILILTAGFAAISSSCLVKEKVTINGQVQEEGYAIKRPIKEAIDNSQ